MSDLVGNPEDRFSRVAAQMIMIGKVHLSKVNFHIFFFFFQASGYMEAAVPYSSVEDVHIISRWDAGQKFCIRITIPDGSLLLQVRL